MRIFIYACITCLANGVALCQQSPFDRNPRLLTAQRLVRSSTSRPAEEIRDARAFATLFRRINIYNSMFRAAKSPDQPEAALPQIFQQTYGISEVDYASLTREARLWEEKTQAERLLLLAAIGRYRERFPNDVMSKGSDTTPPAELAQIKRKLDDITLASRDSLRNVMSEPDFQRFADTIRDAFASGLRVPSVVPSVQGAS